MKKTVPLTKTPRLLNLFTGLMVMSLALATYHPAYASDLTGLRPVMDEHLPSGMRSASTGSCKDTIHSIQVSKSQSSKKNKIRLYPDARQQVLFFSASGEEHKVYQLYLFDMDGRLVNQASIRNRETTVLTNIAGGDYLFEVFTDDERIENGHLAVR
ncbi:MAG TPA: T9SS type A sorting domain-containing protein [Puia sp.]|nr:T9SS type A sorting domain-containing protein [Puia sp.]